MREGPPRHLVQSGAAVIAVTDWQSTAEVGHTLAKNENAVREWGRLCGIRAAKPDFGAVPWAGMLLPPGRGNAA